LFAHVQVFPKDKYIYIVQIKLFTAVLACKDNEAIEKYCR